MKKKIKNWLFYIINPCWQNLKSDTTILVEMICFDFKTGKIRCILRHSLEDEHEWKDLNSDELI